MLAGAGRGGAGRGGAERVRVRVRVLAVASATASKRKPLGPARPQSLAQNREPQRAVLPLLADFGPGYCPKPDSLLEPPTESAAVLFKGGLRLAGRGDRCRPLATLRR